MGYLYEYNVWGHALVSDLDLGLSRTPAGTRTPEAVRIVEDLQRGLPHRPRTDTIECGMEDGNIWLAISRSDTAYVIDFPRLCSFRIDPEQRLIEYAPEPDTGKSTLIHLLLDHALPRLLSLLEDYLVLHASAFAVGNRAVMVLGESVWLALPGYPSVRLWPDSVEAAGIEASSLHEFAHYSSKRRTGASQDRFQFAREPLPLGAAFILSPGESGPCALSSCPVNDAFGALSQGVFRLEIASPVLNRREFEILTDIVGTIPFWLVSHGNDYTKLPELQQRMLAVLR